MEHPVRRLIYTLFKHIPILFKNKLTFKSMQQMQIFETN